MIVFDWTRGGSTNGFIIVFTSNFSLPNLARQIKICRCELKHVTKS